jgi:hypothetical protein
VIRRVLAVALPVVCCLALTSCGDDEGGSGSKGGGSVDGIPAYATTDDAKGAQNFARYWIDTLNEATVSGDTDKLKTLQKGSCSTCSDFARQLDAIYGKGGHVDTRGFTVKKLVTDSSVPDPGAGVSVVLTAAPQTVVLSKGAAPKKYPGGDSRYRMVMLREDDHWVMDRIDVG